MKSVPTLIEDSPTLPGHRLTRAEQNEHKRQILVASAWKVLEERGYQATTLEEVAQRAGFTPRPIYTLFGSKERLALSLFDQLVMHNLDLIEGIKPAPTLEATLMRLADLATELSGSPDFKPQMELTHTLGALALNDDEIRAGLVEIQHRSDTRFVEWLRGCANATGGSFRLPVEHVARIVRAALGALMHDDAIGSNLKGAQVKRELILAFIQEQSSDE